MTCNPVKPDFTEFEITIYSDSLLKNKLRNNTVFLLNDSLKFVIRTNRPLYLKKIEIELIDNSNGKSIFKFDYSAPLGETENNKFFASYELKKIGMKTLHYKFSLRDSVIEKSFNLKVIGRKPKLHNNRNIAIPDEPKFNSSFYMYVHADGTPPLEYEWYKDNIKIEHNEENILAFKTLNPDDFGIYRCKVRNEWGSEKSRQYKLLLDYDRSKPTINIIQPMNLASPVSDIGIKFEVVDESAIGEVKVNGDILTEKEGLYSTQVKLKEGENNIEIIAYDESPNKNKGVENINVIYDPKTVDTKGPDIYLIEPNDSIIYQSSLTLKLNVYDYNKIDHVSINGEKIQPLNSIYSKLITLDKGKNPISIVAQDKSENRNNNSLNINLYCDTSVIDNMKPCIVLIEPSRKRDTVVSENYTVRVDAVDKSGIDWVSINGENAQIIDNRFEKTIKLELDQNKPVRIIAQDNSDNKNRDTMDIEIFRRQKPNPVELDINAVTPSTIEISWSKSQDSTFSKYKVYYSETKDVTFENELSCENTDINDTTCTVDNLKSGTYYYIKVFVFDKNDFYSESDEERKRTGNSKPEFEALEDQVGWEDSTLSFTVKANDPDEDDILTYEMIGKLSSKGLDGAICDRYDGKFLWKPGYDQSGLYKVFFKVRDNGEPPLTDTLEVGITIKNSNQPPEFDTIKSNTIDTVYVTQDTIQIYYDTVYAKDFDGDSVVFSLISGHFPSGMTIDAVIDTSNKDTVTKKAVIQWEPSEKNGDVEVLVLAEDEHNGSDTLTLTIRFPIRFEMIHSLSLPLDAQSLVLSNDYAFIPGGKINNSDKGGFCIIDIKNPGLPIEPVLIGNDMTFEIVISENVAYTVSNTTGLKCFDISNISSIDSLSNSVPIDRAESIVKVGDFVYISDFYKGMLKYNVSNP
ncbi:MAG: fibronectin type III domain-containing protein, partial [Chitinispirillia bacterium]